MSDPVASVLGGASFEGFARITEAGLRGMITLRCDLANAKLKEAVKKLVGVEVPGQRQIALKAGRGAGWMSPDELMILVPYAEAGKTASALSMMLNGVQHLVADVSDARAVYRVEGKAAREVLAKLSPTDLARESFTEGELRRTRLAQVAAAFWIEGDGFTVVSFRSVGHYVFDLLKLSAEPGGEVGLWG